MHAHLVFVTRCRSRVFTEEILDKMHSIFDHVCDKFDTTLDEFNGEGDLVHLLVHCPPKVALSNLVNSLKGVSSRRLRQEFPEHISKHLWAGKLWSPSYFAGSCGGAPIEVLRKYIEGQRAPHSSPS